MKAVAKLIIVNPEGKYLLLERSNHPMFSNDPDLPGGTTEGNESAITTVLREVYEEVGVAIAQADVKQLFAGTKYSAHGTHYTLFTVHMHIEPKITLSWEHASYSWLAKEEFIDTAKHANDTFMHMVAEVVSNG